MTFALRKLVNQCQASAALSALCLLGACASTPQREVPEAFYQATLSIGIAQKIAQTCDRLEAPAEARLALLELTSQSLAAEGISGDDLIGISEALPRERLSTDIDAFAASRSLDIDQPETFCTAGETEMEAESLIGQLLTTARGA